MRVWLLLIGLVHLVVVADSTNQQDGSLNSNHVDSTVNSHNDSKDESVTNNFNGAGSSSEMPVGSAISPTYMSHGSDSCLKGVGGSLQTIGVGISNGSYATDEDCLRLKEAKLLSDLSMKVAAVSRLCTSTEVWISMFQSGTPCPIQQGGRLVVGKRAYLLMKTNPTLYIPNYAEKKDWYNNYLSMGETTDEEDTDRVESISARFRSSLKSTR